MGHARNTSALIRPLARKHKGRTIAASQAQQQGRFAYKGRTIRYHIWPQLVTVNTKVDEDNPTFTLMLFFDPLYKKTHDPGHRLALGRRGHLSYLSRPLACRASPLAAKQMIGLHRQFVFAEDSCFRLPELALWLAMCLPTVLRSCPVPSGFWDRAPKATPGRLRRLLSRAIFPNVLELDPELRKRIPCLTISPRAFMRIVANGPPLDHFFTGN
ncbi:MAG: hypothetical protein R3A44_29010 [Caldilineaceae bacterium]